MSTPTVPLHRPVTGRSTTFPHGRSPGTPPAPRLSPAPGIAETPPVSGSCSGPEDHAALVTEIAQLRTAMASRAAIEQAKGMLMLLTGCGEQGAFNLLAHISSHTHRKVREVAVAIIESACGRERLPADVQAILRDACPPGTAMH